MAILLMVIPPLFDTFDTWDKTPEIPVAGHNTETTLVLISVGVGMYLTVAWLSVILMNWLVALLEPLLCQRTPVVQPHPHGTDYLLLLFSPPLSFISLRI